MSAFDKGPLSYPNVISNTFKLMLKGESPAVLHPSSDLKVYKWLYNFAASANETRYKKTNMLFERFGTISNELYKQINTQKIGM